MPGDTPHAAALALSAGTCDKGRVRRLRDFAGIAVFFSDREIDEIQATVDARREARAARPDDPPEAGVSQPDPKPDEPGSVPRRAVGV